MAAAAAAAATMIVYIDSTMTASATQKVAAAAASNDSSADPQIRHIPQPAYFAVTYSAAFLQIPMPQSLPMLRTFQHGPAGFFVETLSLQYHPTEEQYDSRSPIYLA